MVTYRDNEGNEFELPKLTISLSEEMSTAASGKDIKTQSKNIMEFVKKVLPTEYVTERLGSDKVDEIDIVELRNMYDGVDSAYTMALTASKMERIEDQLKSVAPVLESLEKVNRVQSRQGFNRVK